MKIKYTLLIILFVMIITIRFSNAQQFAIPIEGFAKNKLTYVYMENGTKQQGYIIKINEKKSLIQSVVLKDEEGNKTIVEAKNIKYMYVAPSKLGKFVMANQFQDLNTWGREKNIDTTLFGKGYIYLEKSNVEIEFKDTQEDLVLQLINPTFSDKIKVYHDPVAEKTESISIGINITGGIQRSYYVKKATEKTAYRLRDFSYPKHQFKKIFDDCPEMLEKYKDISTIKWKDFEQHVIEYSEFMRKK